MSQPVYVDFTPMTAPVWTRPLASVYIDRGVIMGINADDHTPIALAPLAPLPVAKHSHKLNGTDKRQRKQAKVSLADAVATPAVATPAVATLETSA